MGRPKNAPNKLLSKKRLYQLSTETIELAMIEFIRHIKIDTLTPEQRNKLQTLYTNFKMIEDSK